MIAECIDKHSCARYVKGLDNVCLRTVQVGIILAKTDKLVCTWIILQDCLICTEYILNNFLDSKDFERMIKNNIDFGEVKIDFCENNVNINPNPKR